MLIMCKQDVAWHMRNENMFGSVGDDKMVFVWDTRVAPDDGAQRMETSCSKHASV